MKIIRCIGGSVKRIILRVSQRPALHRIAATTSVVILLAGFMAACSKSDHSPVTAHQSPKFHCPMHPTVVSDKPGDCPICGMKLVPIKEEKAPVKSDSKAVRYHCPMHPTIISDKPGDCPICGMDLVPIEQRQDEDANYKSTLPGLATVSITPEIRQRMGLTVGTVEKRSLAREVRTSARIVADETRLYRVSVKIDGWVDKLFTATTGQFVKMGDPLLTVYSPDLLTAQNEYLVAVRSSSSNLIASARRRLSLWDVSGEQIDRLEQTGEAEKTLTLYAPASGWVTERMVLPGQKIMAGESLLVIADLSTVWADADIYQSDLPFIKVGMPFEITLPYWPDKKFAGKVTFVSPTLDAESRTLKARLEIPNPELLLKPEMFGTAKLFYDLGEKLAIPEAAVMRSAQQTYAFRDTGDSHLVPTQITIGARIDGYYELLAGLSEGDKVVTSANFLVDSESSMKAAIAGMSADHAH